MTDQAKPSTSYLALGLAVIAFLIIGWQWWSNETLSEKITKLEKENADLVTKIRVQNAAVEQIKIEADEKLAAAKKDIEAAKKTADVHREKATVIYKTIPSTPGDDCKSSLDLINGVAQ